MLYFKTLLITLAMTLGLITGTMVAAQAEDGQYSFRRCVAWDGSIPSLRKEACAQVRWNNQGNNSGVVLEFLDVDTVDGADRFTGYKDVSADFFGTNPYRPKGDWDWGDEPFNFTKNHGSVVGVDNGSTEYHLRMCGGGDNLWWHYRLFANGGAQLVDKGHAEKVGGC